MASMTSFLFATLFGASVSLPFPFNSTAVCNSAECQEVAMIIKGNLDEDADPCNDFYAFACGGFKKLNSIPEGIQSIDGLILLEQQLYARQVGLLDNPELKNHRSKVVRKAKKMYDDCMNGNPENATRQLTDRVFASQVISLVPSRMYKSQFLLNTQEEVCREKVGSRYSFVITRLYLDKYFPVASHEATRDAIKNVWKAYRNNVIKKVPWMDNETEKAVNKGLDDLEMNTGYPDWLADDQELDQEYEGKEHPYWLTNPVTVDAHFNRAVPEISKYNLSVVCKENSE